MSWISRFFAAAGRASAAIVPPRMPAEVRQSELVIVDLATAFDGYTIVALADFHHRHPLNDVRWLRHAVDVANDCQPDVVVLLGDYGSSFKHARAVSREWYRAALPEMAPQLVQLRPADGVLAVLGNHDYYAGADITRAWLRDVGADLLVNDARHVFRGGKTLRFAGLDDLSEGSPDPRAGCAVGEKSPTVVLSHNPDAIGRIDPRLRVDVMLAGHTHGGQIVLPWFGAPLTMSQTCGRASAHGWVANQRAPLYVTRGLGEQLPLPVRVGCRPEIFVLRLRTPRQQPA